MAKRNTYFQDEVIQRKIDAKQLGRTLRYVLPYKKVFMLVGVLMFVSSLVALIPSLILKRITDVVIPNEDYAALAYMVLSMALLAVVEISITFVHSRLMGKTGHSLIAQIRQDIFYKLQELPFEYFDNRPNGKIVVRVTEYVNGLANFFTNFVMMFVIYIIKILVVTVLMLVLSPKLTLIVFLTVIPMMAAVFALRYTIRKMFAVHRAKNSNRTAFLVETIMGEKIVKNYNRAELNLDIYNEVHDQCLKQWKRIFCRNELNTPIVEFFWNAGIFFWKGTTIKKEMEKYLPEVTGLFKGWEMALGSSIEQEFIARAFTDCMNISIDYGVMEKTDRAWMYPAKFDWQDIGSWESLYEFIPHKDANGNVIGPEKYLMENCRDVMVMTPDRKKKMVAIKGLENFMIIDTDDALVICPKDDKKFKEFISGIAMPEFEKYR